MALTIEQFQSQVVASGLLAQEEVSAFIAELSGERRPKDGEQLAREFVKQKKLTKYQAEQIYSGKGKTLILGNYVVLEKLGQGGMGVVLKAEHKRLKRPVALKVMASNLVKTPNALKRFHREVEAAAKLRHPNVVATDDADEAKGTHFLVMEYVEGSDLSVTLAPVAPVEYNLSASSTNSSVYPDCYPNCKEMNMRRTALSGMIFGLLLFCFNGVLRASEADELREKALAIRKEASALAAKGDKKQAERLEKESVKLMEAAERMELKTREGGEKKDRPDIDKEVHHLKERLNDLMARERKMKESQAPENELAEVREQIAGTERKLHTIYARQSGKPEFPPEFRAQAEKLEAAARRIQHIRVAAENLKLAEAHDLAYELMEKAEVMERELQEGKQRLTAEMQKLQGGHDELEIVGDLRAEIERLRAEIKELQQQVEKR